jgi:hypothetical protein
MGGNTPTYTVTHNVGDYSSFIASLRRILANPGSYARGVPVLVGQDDTRPNNFVEILLRTGSTRDSPAVRLTLRRDNLCLIGFRDETTAGRFGPWYEFNSDQQRITGSILLGFEGDYGILESAAGYGTSTRLALALGQHALNRAINQLARVRHPIAGISKTETATSLLVVVQMICESIRFQWITEYLGDIWDRSGPIDVQRQAQMISLESSWSTLSEALIHADQKYEFRYFLNDFPYFRA